MQAAQRQRLVRFARRQSRADGNGVRWHWQAGRQAGKGRAGQLDKWAEPTTPRIARSGPATGHHCRIREQPLHPCEIVGESDRTHRYCLSHSQSEREDASEFPAA